MIYHDTSSTLNLSGLSRSCSRLKNGSTSNDFADFLKLLDYFIYFFGKIWRSLFRASLKGTILIRKK